MGSLGFAGGTARQPPALSSRFSRFSNRSSERQTENFAEADERNSLPPRRGSVAPRRGSVKRGSLPTIADEAPTAQAVLSEPDFLARLHQGCLKCCGCAS